MKKLILILLVIIVSCSPTTEDKPIYVSENTITWDLEEQELFSMVNDYRDTKLQQDDILYKYALQRNNDNILIEGISHTSGFPIVFSKLIDMGLTWVGENLAYGYSNNNSVFNAMIKSEAHNKNLLRKDWKYIGISISKYNDRNYYCVLLSR